MSLNQILETMAGVLGSPIGMDDQPGRGRISKDGLQEGIFYQFGSHVIL
jgi:hypothetical protein